MRNWRWIAPALLPLLMAVAAAAMAERIVLERAGDGRWRVVEPPPAPEPATVPATVPATRPAPRVLALRNGDVLTDRTLTDAAAAGIPVYVQAGAVVTLGNVDGVSVLADGVRVYSDPADPGTIEHPGGLDYPGAIFRAKAANFTLENVRLSTRPTARGVFGVHDTGRGTIVRGVRTTGGITRLVNAGEAGDSVGLRVEDCRTDEPFGSAYDFPDDRLAIVGVYLNARTRDATIAGNVFASTHYCFRDMSGRGTRVIGGNRFLRAHPTQYRSGGITIRPGHADAEALVEDLYVQGPVELGYDTAAVSLYRSITARRVTVDQSRFIQFVGATDGRGRILAEDWVVTAWQGPSGLIDAKRKPAGAVRGWRVEAGPADRPLRLFSGAHAMTVGGNVKGGVELR